MRDIKIGNQVFHVNEVVTPEEQMKGLSGRESMPEDEGLLFVYPKNSEVHYFNTLLMKFPLDIICIWDNTVFQMEKNIKVGKAMIVLPGTKYVLEINSGLCDKYKWGGYTVVSGLDKMEKK